MITIMVGHKSQLAMVALVDCALVATESVATITFTNLF